MMMMAQDQEQQSEKGGFEKDLYEMLLKGTEQKKEMPAPKSLDKTLSQEHSYATASAPKSASVMPSTGVANTWISAVP